MTIKLYPYSESKELVDYSYAKAVRIIENGKTFEITASSGRKEWYSVEEYALEVTE